VSRSITVTAWAKVNYTLDVLSRRPDGFHNLASVMQTVSLGDRISVERAGAAGITLECDDPGLPADESNLAWRAARAALGAAGVDAGLHIRLEKRIPVQAGLGGGSTDAAAVLRATDRLLGLGLGSLRLADIAASLGSDIPFFLTGGTAVVRGRGEAVAPLPDGPALWFVIVKPEVSVSTARAYAALDALPDRVSARATRRMEEALREGDADRVVARMANDFEAAVTEHPGIVALMDDLLMARARNARLCGSGSAVFGVAMGRAEAEEIARIARLKHARVHVCRAISRAESVAMEEAAE